MKLNLILASLILVLSGTAFSFNPEVLPGPGGPGELKGLRFVVEINGVTTIQTLEIDGLSSSFQVIAQPVPTPGIGVIEKRPGAYMVSDVQIKFAMTGNNTPLASWWNQVRTGHIDQARKDVLIRMVDLSGKEVCEAKLARAWPSAIRADFPSAAENTLAVTTLTLSYENLESTCL